MKRKIDKAMNFYFNNYDEFLVIPESREEYGVVKEYYVKVLKKYIKYFLEGNVKTILSLLTEFHSCNWARLHATEEEEARPLKELFDDFYYELHYCSDRMSYMRLMRVHWAWIQFEHRLAKENNWEWDWWLDEEA